MIVSIEDKQAPEAAWIVLYFGGESKAYLRITEEGKLYLIGTDSFEVSKAGGVLRITLLGL